MKIKVKKYWAVVNPGENNLPSAIFEKKIWAEHFYQNYVPGYFNIISYPLQIKNIERKLKEEIK